MAESPGSNEAGAAPEEVRIRVLELLAAQHVVTLASRDDQGTWAAAVFFAHDGLDLYFVSSPTSRHVRSLAFDDRLAGEIHGPATDWHSIVGVQFSGVADELRDGDAAAARSLYARRFPFIDGSAAAADPALARALEKVSWYRLRVDEAVLIDNTRGFGRRLRWSAGAIMGDRSG